MNTLIYFQFTLFIIASLGFIFLGFKLVKKTNDGFTPMDYSELMEIVNTSIEQQFTFKYRLEYQLKDIKMLYDFEKELDVITKSVLMSFSQDFYKHLDYYHDREYMYKYVTKQVQLLLLDFSNKIKIKSK